MQWKWSNNKVFSVKSIYTKWEQQQYMEGKGLFSLWKNICPLFDLFTWLAMQGSIASRAVLVRRGILSQTQEQCPLCNSNAETPNHLLLQCMYAWEVWS
ncbi:hypothetical protein RHMOL_Rhmol07G0155800 [Rhododendron molle]|uniref:Uncharacterized protein n=1 Tax=Rhododendron molle TaxID=49168 RepID=A0ACC0N0Q7_RHOML|nr:hypothetical protein RHMOL_Rhmol07G0155800 [Rhododendron molle]